MPTHLRHTQPPLLDHASGTQTEPSADLSGQTLLTSAGLSTSRDAQFRPLPYGAQVESEPQYVMPPRKQRGEVCIPTVFTRLPRAAGNSVEFLQCTPPTHTGSVDHLNLTLPVGADAYVPPRQDAHCHYNLPPRVCVRATQQLI